MNDRCELIASLASRGPAPIPLRPCCVAALVALHNRNLPDTTWLCPLDEECPPDEQCRPDECPIDEECPPDEQCPPDECPIDEECSPDEQCRPDECPIDEQCPIGEEFPLDEEEHESDSDRPPDL